MSPRDDNLSDPYDRLVNLPPESLAAEFADLVAALSDDVTRRAVRTGPTIPPVSTDIDDFQRALINSTATTVRLLAPAGSGKTHCIVNKVAALVRDGISAERILLVTFDNASRSELQNRVLTLFGATKSPRVSTLNAYGSRLIRQFKYNTGNYPKLINSAPKYQHALLRELLKAVVVKNPAIKAVLPEGVKRTFFLELFSLFKNQLFSVRLVTTPEAGVRAIWNILQPIRTTSAAPLLAAAGTDPKQILLLLTALDWLYRSYEQETHAQGYIDFDDQKLLAYELALENESVRVGIQNSLDVLIVDEFQDLNELDFRLILLVAAKAKLIVVGDDDQAIYGFRGTSPRYILEFATLSNRPLESLPLSFNYRCPANVVTHATNLIRHNTFREEKNPKAVRKEHCDIQVTNALTAAAEASAIGQYIEKLRDAGHPLREIALLYRMNAQSLPLQLELLTRGIPYYCRKEDNIVEQDHLPRVISMLRYAAAVQRGEDPTIEDFLGTVRGYFKFMRDGDDALLRRAATEVSPPFLDAFNSNRLAGTKIANSGVGAAIHSLVRTKSPLEAITTISRNFSGIRGLVGSLEDAVGGEVPLGELGDVAVRFRKLDTFADFLDKALRRARAAEIPEMDSEAVRLLTYFRSKGNQFDTVILPTVNSGIIPHYMAPIEDERRLFYVAVTRTKKNLWLSYVRKSCNQKVEPSPFLKELELPQEAWIEPAPRRRRGGPEATT